MLESNRRFGEGKSMRETCEKPTSCQTSAWRSIVKTVESKERNKERDCYQEKSGKESKNERTYIIRGTAPISV